jgi:hypothetical protein
MIDGVRRLEWMFHPQSAPVKVGIGGKGWLLCRRF